MRLAHALPMRLRDMLPACSVQWAPGRMIASGSDRLGLQKMSRRGLREGCSIAFDASSTALFEAPLATPSFARVSRPATQLGVRTPRQ